MDSICTPDFPDSPAKILKLDDEVSVEDLSSCIRDLNYLKRRNGEQVIFDDNLRRKYVLVFCIQNPPLYDDFRSIFPLDLVKTCSELYDLRDDFEMVVVAKTTESSVGLSNFMGVFPPQCLAVPHKDSTHRKLLCDLLRLDHPGFKCLVVNFEKNIIFNGTSAIEHLHSLRTEQPFGVKRVVKAMWHVMPELAKHPCLSEDCCPVAKQYKHVKPKYPDDIKMTVYELKKTRPIQIGHSFDVVSLLNNCLYRNGGKEIVQVNEETFKGKYIMVCCYHGHFIRQLDKVYRHCKDKDLEIEIVVVYMPLGDCLDPPAYKLNIDTILRRKKIDWWRLPFDNSLSLGLKRLTGCFYKDKLVIVGPCGKYVDIYGEKVIFTYGMDTYPFTREGLLQKELEKLKQLTLESLLVHESRDYVVKRGDIVPVAQLRDKNILIYLDCLNEHEHYNNLFSWYTKVKERVTGADTDFEVVFIRRVEDEVQAAADDDSVVSDMPWFVCPFDFNHSALMNKKLFSTVYDSCDIMVHFGKDGQISGYPTLENLPDHLDSDFNAFVLAGFNLREFVIRQYNEEFMEGIE